MSKAAFTRVPLENWLPDGVEPFASAAEAIREIDADVTDNPERAENTLGVAWTATVILAEGRKRGLIPDPRWYSTLGLFCRLDSVALDRVRDAIDMRMRAITA